MRNFFVLVGSMDRFTSFIHGKSKVMEGPNADDFPPLRREGYSASKSSAAERLDGDQAPIAQASNEMPLQPYWKFLFDTNLTPTLQCCELMICNDKKFVKITHEIHSIGLVLW